MELKKRIMKTKYFILLLGLSLGLASCEIDNYDEPNAVFSGQITYEGEPIGVAYNDVRFQLWQSGFGNEGPIDVHLDQDGSFSTHLFNGSYRLSFIEGQGPFEAQQDTLQIDLQGNTNQDIEVTPYYMIRNANFNQTGNSVQGSANLEQIITGEDSREIEHVTLYLNRTQFVSHTGDGNIAHSDADLEDLNNLTMEVDIPDDLNQDYVFARIGVRIQGEEDMLFSEVEKIDL